MIRTSTTITCASVLLCTSAAANAVRPPGMGTQAVYIVSTSREGETPPVQSVLIRIGEAENVGRDAFVWWEMTVALADGGRFGVKILSEHRPMAKGDDLGRIERYVYRDADGKVVEYRDTATGKALLPMLDFRTAFLPHPSYDATYRCGPEVDDFASSGTYLGHVLTRVRRVDGLDPVAFDDPIVLDLRNDLLMGPSIAYREDPTKIKNDGSDPVYRPLNHAELRELIDAGMNYFGVTDEQLPWVLYEAVFYRGKPRYPDSFYRSNYHPADMFIDEPSVRLGWSGGIPANVTGPEQVAESMRGHVASQYVSAQRRPEIPKHVGMGTLDLLLPKPVSWDTDFWSAWYQLAAGAPGIVHEGRFVKRGYGWEPETLFGAEGLEALTFRDQVNCLNAFLRGAARAFDGDWGTSVYPEGDPELRAPALIQAYDMGARYLWFWVHYPNMRYEVQRDVARKVGRHIAEHPRRDRRAASRAGKVGIAFPPGFAFNWDGTWGLRREQQVYSGASCGDIAAAGMWEGILCSRMNIPFDFLVDEPRIRNLGYERLLIVHEDGFVEARPPWPQPRVATTCKVTLTRHEGPTIAERAAAFAKPDYIVRRAEAVAAPRAEPTGRRRADRRAEPRSDPRARARAERRADLRPGGPPASGIAIDGDRRDWEDVNWIKLRPVENGFADMIDVDLTITNIASAAEYDGREYMGFKYDQLSFELQDKYRLEGFWKNKGVVVTEVRPGSAADRAGLRVGDVIYEFGDRHIDWVMHIWPYLDQLKTAYKKEIPVKVHRSGSDYFGRKPGDCDADIAMAVDDKYLYLLARVRDDMQNQPHDGWSAWQGDSLQIGLDPALERRDMDYGEEEHEIGFFLDEGEPVVWRYRGRRGQPLGEMRDVDVEIVRKDDVTTYEAAIPLTALAPAAPDLWPVAGFNVVVNDNDGGLKRKGRVEYRLLTMTRQKRPKGWATLRFEPSPDNNKVSAALLWQKRATLTGGEFTLRLAARSPATREAAVKVGLGGLDPLPTVPARATANIPITPEPVEWDVHVTTDAPPGRYLLHVDVVYGKVDRATADSLPAFVYPPTTP